MGEKKNLLPFNSVNKKGRELGVSKMLSPRWWGRANQPLSNSFRMRQPIVLESTFRIKELNRCISGNGRGFSALSIKMHYFDQGVEGSRSSNRFKKGGQLRVSNSRSSVRTRVDQAEH